MKSFFFYTNSSVKWGSEPAMGICVTSSVIHSQLYAVCDVIWKQMCPSSSVGMVYVSSFRSVNIILILPEFLYNSGKENIVLPNSCHQGNNRLKLLLPYFWTLLPFYSPLKNETEIHHSHMRCVYRPGALCVLTRGTCVLYCVLLLAYSGGRNSMVPSLKNGSELQSFSWIKG